MIQRSLRLALYALLGLLSTLLVSLGLLILTQPIQARIYDLLYLQVGPSEATEAAILIHFLGSALAALAVAMLAGEYLSDGGQHRTAIARAIGLMGLFLVGFLVVAMAGLAAFLTAMLVLGIALVVIPLVLRYRYDVSSGAIPALVGGIPVLLLLLLLVGFGLGWGWGYYLMAEPVPPSAVDGPVASFDEVPGVWGDLFTGPGCAMDSGAGEECLLQLRGYEHELEAARFMARHGVRCPYQNAATPWSADSFVATAGGQHYRVSCLPHGD